MTTLNTAAHRSAETLRAAIAGEVFVPGEAGYDQARQAWNLAVDQRPSVVVAAESPADVAHAVRFAGAHGMRIAPQGTGHGAEPLESLQGAMLLRTARMRSVRVDPAARSARAEAGAVWQDVTVPAGQHGLAALAGTSPNVGVTGYILGGGSGSVGVVTALEMRLYPVHELYAGVLFFPIGRSGEVLHTWRAWTGTVPDEVTSLGRILRLPPLPEVPEPLRGRAFALVEAAYLGDADTGAELIRPLRRLGPELDTFAMIRAPALAQLHMDPDQPVPGQGDGAFLADAPAATIDALIAVVGPGADTPLASVEIRHLGGALARPAPGGAQPSIDAKFLMFAGGFGPTPELASAVRAHAQAVKDALAPWHASYDYYNFEKTPAAASAVLAPASYRRLQKIKASYDPGQVIISAHPVWPSRGDTRRNDSQRNEVEQ